MHMHKQIIADFSTPSRKDECRICDKTPLLGSHDACMCVRKCVFLPSGRLAPVMTVGVHCGVVRLPSVRLRHDYTLFVHAFVHGRCVEFGLADTDARAISVTNPRTKYKTLYLHTAEDRRRVSHDESCADGHTGARSAGGGHPSRYCQVARCRQRQREIRFVRGAAGTHVGLQAFKTTVQNMDMNLIMIYVSVAAPATAWRPRGVRRRYNFDAPLPRLQNGGSLPMNLEDATSQRSTAVR